MGLRRSGSPSGIRGCPEPVDFSSETCREVWLGMGGGGQGPVPCVYIRVHCFNQLFFYHEPCLCPTTPQACKKHRCLRPRPCCRDTASSTLEILPAKATRLPSLVPTYLNLCRSCVRCMPNRHVHVGLHVLCTLPSSPSLPPSPRQGIQTSSARRLTAQDPFPPNFMKH